MYIEYLLPIVTFAIGLVFISIRDVIKNIPTNNLGSTYTFFKVALRDTELSIKGLCVVFALSSIYLLAKNGSGLIHKIQFPRSFKFLFIRH
jgi:hypothetical protein